MRYASKKEEQRGILPVMNPLFNLREICKQSALLEDHLNNPRKRCPDCIRKHFLTIEALYEEAVSLDKKFQYGEYLDGKAEMMRDLQGRWLDSKDTKKYHDTCGQVSQELRVIRKEYAPLCFDVRKLASLIAPEVCHHMRRASEDYSDYEEMMDDLLDRFNRGNDTLYVDWEWEIADYFGSFEGMPPQEPTYIKDLYLLPKGKEPSKYQMGLMEAEYFYKSEYIPMVKAIIKGLKNEERELEELDSPRKALNSLEWKLEEYEDQLKLLERSKRATLSRSEHEEREIERLVKPKPKKKPPRKDLMRKKVQEKDPDLENLGGGAGGDRDLSMNHKRVAFQTRVARRVMLRRKIALRLLAQDEKKKKTPNER